MRGTLTRISARIVALVAMLVLGAVFVAAVLALARPALPAWIGPTFPGWTIHVAASAAMTIAVLARTPSLGRRAAAWIAGTLAGAAVPLLLERYALRGFDPANVDWWAGFPTLLVLDYARSVLAPALAIVAAVAVLELEPDPPPVPVTTSGMIDR